MLPLKALPASQRHELLKLRVLQVLSDPATPEHGLSATRIERETGGVDVERLLPQMEAEGLIEGKVNPGNKSARPVAITAEGKSYLAVSVR